LASKGDDNDKEPESTDNTNVGLTTAIFPTNLLSALSNQANATASAATVGATMVGATTAGTTTAGAMMASDATVGAMMASAATVGATMASALTAGATMASALTAGATMASATTAGAKPCRMRSPPKIWRAMGIGLNPFAGTRHTRISKHFSKVHANDGGAKLAETVKLFKAKNLKADDIPEMSNRDFIDFGFTGNILIRSCSVFREELIAFIQHACPFLQGDKFDETVNALFDGTTQITVDRLKDPAYAVHARLMIDASLYNAIQVQSTKEEQVVIRD
jgi:hypothetical protein